jgi:hypothetical protein
MQVDSNLASGFVVKMRTVERANNNNERSKEASFADKVAAKRRRCNERTGFEEEGAQLQREKGGREEVAGEHENANSKTGGRQMRRPIRA